MKFSPGEYCHPQACSFQFFIMNCKVLTEYRKLSQSNFGSHACFTLTRLVSYPDNRVLIFPTSDIYVIFSPLSWKPFLYFITLFLFFICDNSSQVIHILQRLLQSLKLTCMSIFLLRQMVLFQFSSVQSLSRVRLFLAVTIKLYTMKSKYIIPNSLIYIPGTMFHQLLVYPREIT